MKSPKRSIVKNGLFGYMIKLFFPRDRQTECGPSRGEEGNVLVEECMNDITSHLASCHLSKGRKVNDWMNSF